MTPRGVCRLLMVAIMLIGSGLGPMFNLSSATPVQAAARPAATTILPSLPGAPTAAPPVTCTSGYPQNGSPFGLAGLVQQDGFPLVPANPAQVALVDANDNPLALVDSNGNPILNPRNTNDSPTNRGTYIFGGMDVTPLQNFSIRYTLPGGITEYYGGRYDITSSVKLTITNNAGNSGQPCVIVDQYGKAPIQGGGLPVEDMFSLVGFAGRVTGIAPPTSLPAPVPIADGTTPIPAANVKVYKFDINTGTIITPAIKSVVTDNDGYYRVGSINPVSDGTNNYVIEFSKPGYLPDPANASNGNYGSFWRDGNFNFSPFNNWPNYYALQPITVQNPPGGVPLSYITYVTPNGTLGSYPGVKGINGHLIVPASITGTVTDATGVNGIANVTVEAYERFTLNKVGTSNATDTSGSYRIDGLLPNQDYFLRAVPQQPSSFLPRWYPDNPGATQYASIPPPPDANPVILKNQNIILRPGYKFTGQVTPQGGGSLGGPVQVLVYDASDPVTTAVPIDAVTTDNNGFYNTNTFLQYGKSYRLGFVPQGINFVSAFCANLSGGNCTNVPNLDPNNSGATSITIQGNTTANIVLTPGNIVQGTIRANVPSLTAAGLQVQIYVYSTNNNQLDKLFQSFTVSATNSTFISYSTGALPQGNYKIQFVPLPSNLNTGFISRYLLSGNTAGVPDFASASTINIPAGTNSPQNGQDITLVQGGQINLHLQIRDRINPSVLRDASNVQVQLFSSATTFGSANEGTLLTAGTTDINGTITFRGLDLSGNPYALKVLAGTGYATTWVTTTNPTKELYILSNGNGLNTPLNLNYIMSPGATISGQIRDVANNITFDFSKTVISVYEGGTQKLLYTISGTNFIGPCTATSCPYTLTLSPGNYYLGFTPPAGGGYVQEFYPNATSLGSAQQLNLQNNQILTGFDMLFEPLGYLKVYVRDGNNKAQGNATVNIWQQVGNNRQIFKSGFADANGIYTSTLLPSRPTYWVSAVSGGLNGFYNCYPNFCTVDTATDLNIAGANTTFITLTIGAQTNVTGKVKVHPSSGSDVPQANVIVSAVDAVNPNNVLRSTTTDTLGNYSLGFDPQGGSYKVKFEYRFNTYASVNVSSTTFYNNALYGSDFAGASTFTGNADQSNVNVTFDQGSSLVGQVVTYNNNNGNPLTNGLPNIGVTVVSLDGAQVIAGTTSGVNGAYSLPNLAPGTYLIRYIDGSGTYQPSPAYYKINKNNGTSTLAQASPVTLVDGTPQVVNPTYDITNNGANPCVVTAVPVNASTNNVSISFSGSGTCSGTGKVYWSTNQGFVSTPFSITDGIVSQDHKIQITGLQADTNYYVKAEITFSGTPYTSTEIVARTSAGGTAWYFAYGDIRSTSTVSNTEILHLFNYQAQSAQITVSYVITVGNNTQVLTRLFPLNGNSRLDIDVGKASDPNSLMGHPQYASFAPTGTLHSTLVNSNVGIVVERSTYNNITSGVSGGGNNAASGGTIMPGSASLSSDWYFPDIISDTAKNYSQNYWLFNPGPNNACINFTYFAAGEKAQLGSLVLVPNGRVVIDARNSSYTPDMWFRLFAQGAPKPTPNNWSTSIQSVTGASCSSVQPIVAELQTVYNNGQTGDSYRKGESQMYGGISKGKQWFFLEGLTDKVTARDYVIMNPNNSVANITLVRWLDNPPAGSANPTTTNYTVPAYSQIRVPVADLNKAAIGRTFGFTVRVDSNQDVVVQRSIQFMWRALPINDGWFDQVGNTRYANTWIFGAGSTTNDTTNNRLNDMAYNIYNPNNAAVKLNFTYYFGDGTTQVIKGFYLNPGSRTRVQPNAKPFSGYPSVGSGKNLLSVKIESVDTNDNPVPELPIFAERIMYFTWGASINGGNAVFGYNPPGS